MAEFSRQTEELKGANIAAQRDLEAEKTKRLELEKAVGPRTVGEQGKFANALKEFSGTSYFLRYVPDWEARRFAGEISFTLREAEWKYIEENKPLGEPFDGVTIEGDNRDAEAVDAANALRDELEKNGVECHRIPQIDLPPKTIRIVVGANPMTYFRDQWKTPEEKARDEEFKKRELQYRAEDKERRKQDKERARENEALMEKLRRELGEEEMKKRGIIVPDPKPEGEHK